MSLVKSFILFTAFVGAAALAKDPQPAKEGPCKKLIDACKTAGFSKSDKKDKKGLFKNCIRPVMRGENVADVKVNSADVDACRAKKRSMPNFK